ncbi:MAG: phospho-N-acetylmuramoyl-pentapeptide-transferase [Candidatus Methylacidiphilales bacterium]
MLYYLKEWDEYFGPLRVFDSNTFRAIGAAVTAFLITLICGPSFIRALTRLKMGQPIRGHDEVHKLADLHGSKKGTPTMGGVMILFALMTSCLLWANPANSYLWLVMVPTMLFGALGFTDDYLKIKRKKSEGLTSKQKLLGQIIISVAVSVFLINYPETAEASRSLQLPFIKQTVVDDLGWMAVIFFCFVIVGCSNAVNLTDGLDGLAIGCSLPVAAVFGIFAYASGHAVAAEYLLLDFMPGVGELSIVCAALAGAGAGFLWFNCHPARVFMGDTGSLALGGAFAMLSICLNQELLLIILGGVFVMEAASVILQVFFFKTTGRRIFAMSPIHHHFELKGWNETTVVVRFWILAVICALIALTTLKLR